MDNFKLLDSLHTKILHSKLAETITEQEIDAFIDCKEQMKETYNQALEDFSAKMKEVNLTNSFALYCGAEIDLEEFMILASEEIKEQLIKQELKGFD